jgi:hypothetical protein
VGELVPDRSEAMSPAVARRDMRVSDDDRKAVVDELRVHFGVGRLDLAEFEDRTNAALSARVRGELEPLLDDLPLLRQPGSGPPIREREPSTGSALKVHFFLWLVVSIFLIMIWAGASMVSDGGTVPFWPIFPISAIGLSVGVHWAINKGFDDD